MDELEKSVFESMAESSSMKPEVKVGQVYRDKDKREVGRYLLVTWLTYKHEKAWLVACTNEGRQINSRVTKINPKNLQSRFELVGKDGIGNENANSESDKSVCAVVSLLSENWLAEITARRTRKSLVAIPRRLRCSTYTVCVTRGDRGEVNGK